MIRAPATAVAAAAAAAATLRPCMVRNMHVLPAPFGKAAQKDHLRGILTHPQVVSHLPLTHAWAIL
ncbi:hypothetical protein HDU86_003160, partial [Geranomyces michiganensis]